MTTSWLDRLPQGPILVVADNDAIANSGLRWARIFEKAQRLYRVRLAGPSTLEAVVNEAKSLGAVAITWAGDSEACSLAEATASQLGIPFSSEDSLNDVYDV